LKLQQKIITMVSLFSLVLVLGACTGKVITPNKSTLSLIINGEKIENTGLVQIENSMYIPETFITEVLGVKFAAPEDKFIEEANGELKDGVHFSDKVGVLMYHAIMDEPENGGIISTKQFREHLQWLKDGGFQPISMEQYVAFIHEQGEVPDNAVLITFDDGYENFYTNAYPLLKEFQYPAVNFVIVSGVDDPNLPGIKKLSWDQMREMKQHNMAFHNHTNNMHIYGAVDEEGKEKPVAISKLYLPEEKRVETEEEYTARVTEDLSKAEQRLKEELGNTFSVIAFPYGAFNEQLLSIIKSIGIETSFTVKPGINNSEDVNGYRINGGRSDKTAEEMLSGLRPQPIVNDGTTMMLNDKMVVFTKVIKQKENEPALYPLREISSELGFFISWDNTTKTVSLSK